MASDNEILSEFASKDCILQESICYLDNKNFVNFVERVKKDLESESGIINQVGSNPLYNFAFD